MQGKDIWALIAPDYAATREKILQDLLAQGEMTFESAHVRKDGSVMPVEIHARIIDLGERRLVLSVARDISERKRASQEIARLASFPQLNPNPVLEVDNAGNITFANPAALKTPGNWAFRTRNLSCPQTWTRFCRRSLKKGKGNSIGRWKLRERFLRFISISPRSSR